MENKICTLVPGELGGKSKIHEHGSNQEVASRRIAEIQPSPSPSTPSNMEHCLSGKTDDVRAGWANTAGGGEGLRAAFPLTEASRFWGPDNLLKQKKGRYQEAESTGIFL